MNPIHFINDPHLAWAHGPQLYNKFTNGLYIELYYVVLYIILPTIVRRIQCFTQFQHAHFYVIQQSWSYVEGLTRGEISAYPSLTDASRTYQQKSEGHCHSCKRHHTCTFCGYIPPGTTSSREEPIEMCTIPPMLHHNIFGEFLAVQATCFGGALSPSSDQLEWRIPSNSCHLVCMLYVARLFCTSAQRS